MGITDATTNLDTTYTEQSTVAFTAGTLSTVADLVTEVESKLQRGILSTSSLPKASDVQRWLIRAKQEIAGVKNFTWKRRYASVTTVANQYRYSLPPDYQGGFTKLRDVSNNKAIIIINTHMFDERYPDPSEESQGEVEVAAVKNMEVWFAPVPGDAYDIELEYDRSGDDNTPTDFSWLPESERFLCCDFAISEAFEALRNYSAMNSFRNKWKEGMRRAERSDGKKKWKTTDFQARSIFQQHKAHNTQ